MDEPKKYERYLRQITLKEFGTIGQEKLFHAKVLVIGAGGLGCPALQYLAAAGVGTIGIVDFDIIELSNLQRQTLYSVEDIGKMKAGVAAAKLKLMNPDIRINIYCTKLDPGNTLGTLDDYDIIIDGTDNFSTRYMVNDACVLLNKPLVYGAVLRFEGQVGVFNFPVIGKAYKTNYRDLFPSPPSPSTVFSCSEAGVLGVLPGLIGTFQASEAIKLITGMGEPLCNKILSINLLSNLFYEFSISPGEKNPSTPGTKEAFERFDYDWFCGHRDEPLEISTGKFDTIKSQEGITIIDIREEGELPVINEFSFVQIPMSSFDITGFTSNLNKETVLICQSGKRSLALAKKIKEKYPQSNVWSLRGGIEAWKNDHNSKVSKKELLSDYEKRENT